MATTPTTQQLAIANLYTALFNRAPDAAGLVFWVQALNNGASLSTITQSILTTAEAKTIYPAAQTAEQFIASFYQSVLGRVPDTAGLAFWTAALNADGGTSSAAAKALLVSQLVGIASTPLTSKPADLTDAQYAQTIADRAVFGNKVAVGVYFAVELGGTNVELAKQVLAGVGSTAASVDAAKLIAGGTSPSAPVIVAPVSLLATASTDTLSGTAGNDTFTATNLTLGALDSIDGGAGTDTLNYLDASATAAAIPVAGVRNVEIINVRNVNTAGVGTEVVSFTVESGNGLTVGQTLTIAGLTATGIGDASDTDIAVALRTGMTAGNAVVTGTLDPGYIASGADDTVIFTSRVPGNVPNLVAGGSNLSDVNPRIVQGTNGASDTVIAGNFVGATNFNSDRSTVAVIFTGLAAGQAVGIVGDNAVVNGDLTGSYAAGVSAATLNVSGGTKGGNVTINSVSGSSLANVTLTSTGLVNVLGDLALASTVSSLAVDASTNLTMSAITAAGLRTIQVSGVAQAVSLGNVTSTVLESVDASGLRSGGVAVNLGANVATTFTGSAANDIVSITGGIAMTGTVDGGAGTDTLALSKGQSLTPATAAHFINFEVLRVSASFSTQGYDASLIAGVRFEIGASPISNLSLIKLAADAAVALVGNNGNVTLSLADASGVDDSLNFTMGNAGASAGALSNSVRADLSLPGIETVYLHSVGIAGGTGGNIFHLYSASSTSLSKLVIDGSQPTILRLGTITWAFTVDATAATGAVTIEETDVTQTFNVSGSTASDKIIGGRAGGLIVGGTGGDAISLYVGSGVDTVAYRTAADSRQDFVNVAGSAAATQDAISGFATGTDKIDLKALALDMAIRSFVTKTFASTALLVVGEAAADFYLDAGANQGAVAAKVGSDTYLVVDANGDHLFNAATDLVVKLTGVTALAQGDVVYA